jgi:hypothetical protein
MSSVRENAYLEANRVSALTATIVSSWVGGASCSWWPVYDMSLPLHKPSLFFTHFLLIQQPCTQKRQSDYALQQVVGCRAHTPLDRLLPFPKNIHSYSSVKSRLCHLSMGLPKSAHQPSSLRIQSFSCHPSPSNPAPTYAVAKQ